MYLIYLFNLSSVGGLDVSDKKGRVQKVKHGISIFDLLHNCKSTKVYIFGFPFLGGGGLSLT